MYISKKESKLSEQERKEHNKKFISESMINLKSYFDDMFINIDPNIHLDENQIKAILTIDDYNMIIAGAGCGKTTTLAALVKYLVEILKEDPKSILLISFTNKAVLELKNRINNDFKINCEIETFHKLGIKILNDKTYKVLPNSYDLIKSYFDNILCCDNKTLKLFLKYFNEYFELNDYILNFDSIDSYLKFKKRFSFLFFKNNMKLRSIDGNIFDNIEDLVISNFLFTYKIKYQYNKTYFRIHQNDNIINLKYSKKINLKQNSFVLFNYKNDIKKELKELLLKNNFVLDKMDNKLIFEELINNNKDMYYEKFIDLCTNFISKLKIKSIDIDDIKCKTEKDMIFKKFIKNVYEYYQSYLNKNKLLDFEDIINKATEKATSTKYKYIIVDEYQDISKQRFDLIKKISDISNAKITVVGDDFQSIYAFSGSNIDLFTSFCNMVGYSCKNVIPTTYRNSQNLINVAGKFVMQNKNQIKKKLISFKKLKNPVIIVYYKDKVKQLNDIINKIIIEFGYNKNILITARYNFTINNYLGDYFYKEGEKIISKFYPKADITFLSVHASKGLGFDNVIILDVNNSIYGFPSKIDNDSIMKLIDNDINYINEERRLFYVALTRTKNRVYILSDKFNKSTFLKELETYDDVVIIK